MARFSNDPIVVRAKALTGRAAEAARAKARAAGFYRVEDMAHREARDQHIAHLPQREATVAAFVAMVRGEFLAAGVSIPDAIDVVLEYALTGDFAGFPHRLYMEAFGSLPYGLNPEYHLVKASEEAFRAAQKAAEGNPRGRQTYLQGCLDELRLGRLRNFASVMRGQSATETNPVAALAINEVFEDLDAVFFSGIKRVD